MYFRNEINPLISTNFEAHLFIESTNEEYLCRRYHFRGTFVHVGTRNGNPMKTSRPIELADRPGALSPADVEEVPQCPRATSERGWMYRYRRSYRNVKSTWPMQIYGVTVNTAAKHIIHSDAHLTERVHAFTLGMDDGTRTGSSAARIPRGRSRRVGRTHVRIRMHASTHVRTYARTRAHVPGAGLMLSA